MAEPYTGSGSPFASWMGVLVGDPLYNPLYNPFKHDPRVKEEDVKPSPRGGQPAFER